jgi:hypothetical protein
MSDSVPNELSDPPPTDIGPNEAGFDDPAFAAECMAHFLIGSVYEGSELSDPLITRSDKWGSILRMDYKMPGQTLGKHRVIYWRISPGARLWSVHAWGLAENTL